MCSGASRKNKVSLMHKATSSSFCWSIGAWTVTKRQLSDLRAALATPAKRALRAPRYWAESDEAYHRRLNRLLQKTLLEADVSTLDKYIQKRVYDYAGHLVRALSDNPAHLTGLVLRYRDAEAKEALAAQVGHQGHPGRFAPWNWERQFHGFFRRGGESWQEVAGDRLSWVDYRPCWINFMIDRRAAF